MSTNEQTRVTYNYLGGFIQAIIIVIILVAAYGVSRIGVSRALLYLDAMMPAQLTVDVPRPTALPFPTQRPFITNGSGDSAPAFQGNTNVSPESDPVATPPPLQAAPAEPAPANLAPSNVSDNPGYDAGVEPGCNAECAAASEQLAKELKVQQQIDSLYKADENTGKNPNLGVSKPGDNPGFTADGETFP